MVRAKKCMAAVLALALCLLCLAGCGKEEEQAQQTPIRQSAQWVTATPAPTPEPTAEPTPEPTAEPSPTPEPTAPPDATPTPPPAKSPGEVIASGSATSDTGTALALRVDWEAVEMGGGKMKLNVKGTVESYSLQITARQATVEFAGESTTCECEGIVIEDTDVKVETELFSTSLEVDSEATGTLKVTWDYRGTYSGVDLPEITTEAAIS